MEKKLWMCIPTYGYGPSARWNASLAVSEQDSKIYVFGGSNHTEGFCNNRVYCLDYSTSGVRGLMAETNKCLEEVSILMRNYQRNAAIR